MHDIEHLPAFLLAATLVILIPGPATLYVAGRTQRSVSSGCWATLGIVAGDIVLITLSGFGFAALVAQWPLLQAVIKVGGGLYVAYLALELFNSPTSQNYAGPAKPAPGGFAKALLITLANPKPILFFAAFFPMFIDKAAGSTTRSFFALGAMFEVINLVYFAALIAIVARLQRAQLLGQSGSALLQKISAVGLLICSAVVLSSIRL